MDPFNRIEPYPFVISKQCQHACITSEVKWHLQRHHKGTISSIRRREIQARVGEMEGLLRTQKELRTTFRTPPPETDPILYQLAMDCLAVNHEDPLCQYMLLLVLTILLVVGDAIHQTIYAVLQHDGHAEVSGAAGARAHDEDVLHIKFCHRAVFTTVPRVLTEEDFVLAQFEAGKEAATDDPMMAPMYNSGWAKLDKYYCLTDESPAYVAAIVLHPSHKWHYIQENWKQEWVQSSKRLMEALWSEYNPVESALPLCQASSTTSTPTLQSHHSQNEHQQPRRDNKKPPYRGDPIRALQHFDERLVCQARRRVTLVFLESESESDQERNHASDASVVMQQELAEFVIDHLDFFRTPAARADLAERLEAATEGTYEKRFSRKANEGDGQPVQQDLANAMLEFCSGKGGTTDRGVLEQVLRDSDFRQKLGKWLAEHYGQDDHRKQGGTALERGVDGKPGLAAGGLRNALARQDGPDNDRSSARCDMEWGAPRRVERTSEDEERPAIPEGTVITQEKSPMHIPRRAVLSSHNTLGSRRPYPYLGRFLSLRPAHLRLLPDREEQSMDPGNRTRQDPGHRYTMDYGRRSAGSKPASRADEYYPTFSLDMFSVVGKPLHAIAKESSFFDNVTFTLQHWAAPYSSRMPLAVSHSTLSTARSG
ncbi:Zinc finger BED domain-containing protein [Paramyrothecium foliicola]|nr:Zinc finger BED domain-containing protein [Paramyrothecium foliicola]